MLKQARLTLNQWEALEQFASEWEEDAERKESEGRKDVRHTAPRYTLAGHLTRQYVIVRSRNEGVNAGYLEEAGVGYVVLSEARRLWFHRPADQSQSWYEGVANSGLAGGCKISAPVTRKVIVEDYSITQCTAAAETSIREYESHGQ